MIFHLDEDHSQTIAQLARMRLALDITSAHELGLEGIPDEDQLAFATEEGRCLVTRNRDDFAEIALRYLAAAIGFSSIILVPESFPPNDYWRITRALAYMNALYPEPFIPDFVGFLTPAPDDWQPGDRV